jgi:hypothetical protein
MNLNPLPWFRGQLIRPELAKWTAAGLIQPDQEQRIGEHYDQDCCGVAVSDSARTAFFALASFSTLLALTLVIVDHWREVYLPMKVSAALIGMSVAHGFGYWYRFHMDEERRGNTWFFVGCIIFGCAMLMAVDQYFARSPYRNQPFGWVLFAWAAGTLPLAWVLGSRAMLGLASIVGTAWVVWHIATTGSGGPTPVFVAQQLCLLRWSYANRARSLFVVTLLGVIVWWCMLTVAEGWGREGFFWIAASGPLLYLIGLRHDAGHPFAAIYKTVGMSICLLALPALAMASVSRDLVESGHMLRFWLVAAAAIGGMIMIVGAPRRVEFASDWPAIAVLVSVTVLPAAVGLIAFGQGWMVPGTILLVAIFNAAVLLAVISLVFRGMSTSCSGCVAAGVVYFGLWVVLVVTDLAGAWTAAAIIFAVAGAVLLTVARLHSREQVSNHETVSTESA